MPSEYDLIGGPNHGETAGVADAKNTYDSPVYVDELKQRESSHSESYTRRVYSGEEFGESYECFGLTDDDEVETRELARMEISRTRGNPMHPLYR